MKKRIKKIRCFVNKPIKTQKKVFEKLIRLAENTQFGNDHKFKKINNYQSFQKLIPIRTYEQIYSYIKRVRNGEKNILWNEKIKCFAKSSGTTNNQSKYIPITTKSLKDCHFKGGKDMLAIYKKNYPNIDIFNGKGLMLAGTISKSKDAIYNDGDLSAILLDEFPFWVNYHRIPDINTALMSNWEIKLDKIAKQAINENITNITGVPSWMLIILKRVVKISGKKNISEVWPNLEVYMHGGVNFEPYRKQFEKLIPSKKMNYLEGYNASEGFMGIQDRTPSKGLLLMLDHGIFYEFIPMKKFKKNKVEAITLSQ